MENEKKDFDKIVDYVWKSVIVPTYSSFNLRTGGLLCLAWVYALWATEGGKKFPQSRFPTCSAMASRPLSPAETVTKRKIFGF